MPTSDLDIDWSSIIRLSDWASTLQRILTVAEAAIKSTDGQRQEASRLLQAFIKNSPTSAAALDTVATDAVIALNLAVISDALRAMHQANDDLAKQIALITGATLQAEAASQPGRLRLDHANQLLAGATAVLTALHTSPDGLDRSTTDKIDAVLKAVAELATPPPPAP